MTVVVPVRDEEERIDACLAALGDQDMPAGEVEVLVVDGGSSDRTVAVASAALAGGPWARAEVLASPAGDRASNLNWGLAHAQAPLVVRVDARSRVPRHYVRRCVETLETRPDVAAVGGRQVAVAPGPGPVGTGVARALNNRWGMGLARYRRSSTAGPADTVYLGSYRTAQLRAVGGWRPELEVNEDFDLNRRLQRHGLIWFDPELAVGYVPRDSLVALFRQYRGFGAGKALYWRMSGDRPRPRQVALLAAGPVAVATVVTVLALLGPVAALLPVAALVVGLVALEALGATGPPGGPSAHAVGVAALVCVATAWLGGVVLSTARGRRDGKRGSQPRPHPGAARVSCPPGPR